MQKKQLTASTQINMSKLIPRKYDDPQQIQLTSRAKTNMYKSIPLKSDGLQKFQLTSSARINIPNKYDDDLTKPS